MKIEFLTEAFPWDFQALVSVCVCVRVVVKFNVAYKQFACIWPSPYHYKLQKGLQNRGQYAVSTGPASVLTSMVLRARVHAERGAIIICITNAAVATCFILPYGALAEI